jgi:hypothetical protein
MTLSTITLPALAAEDIERQSDMLQRMRDLASKVNSTPDFATTHSMDWSSVPQLGSISGTESVSGTNIPWTMTTNTTSIPSLQGPVTYGATGSGGAGIIGNGTYTIVSLDSTKNSSLEIQGKNADIRINGKSMTAWMEKVEERLNILTPNAELEKEWDDLRRLGERYRKLEKKCQEKSQMWETLKKLPKIKV